MCGHFNPYKHYSLSLSETGLMWSSLANVHRTVQSSTPPHSLSTTAEQV